MSAEVDVIEGASADACVFRVGRLPLVEASAVGVRTVDGRTVGPDLIWLLQFACHMVQFLSYGTDLEKIRTRLDQEISLRLRADMRRAWEPEA